MNILILAAGEQTRWEEQRKFPANKMVGVARKQLLPVTGIPDTETILHRIIRQCRQRGHEPTLVTHHRDLHNVVDCRIHVPLYRRWTVETFLHSIWGEDRTVVLLADTIYSRTILNRILDDPAPMRVFGNEYEIYAISFNRLTSNKVRDSLLSAIRHAEAGGPGKLRKFYQAYCNLDMDSDQMEARILSRVCYIQDYTRDIDTPNDYRAHIQQVIKRGLPDD